MLLPKATTHSPSKNGWRTKIHCRDDTQIPFLPACSLALPKFFQKATAIYKKFSTLLVASSKSCFASLRRFHPCSFINSSNNKALKQNSSSLSLSSVNFISPLNHTTPSIIATLSTFEGHLVSFTKLTASLN